MKTTVIAIVLASTALGGLAIAQDGPRPGAPTEIRDGDRGELRRAQFRRGGERGGRGGRAQEMLRMFDTDGDGGVTQAEIDAFRASQIADADTDGDGALTLEEYENLWLAVMRERMVDRFQSHDDDGDGLVTAEEFNERFVGLVARMDQNDDGVLNLDDARARRGE